jgi:chromosome segregation ATPase
MANVTPLTVEQIAEARKNATETEGHIVGKFIVFMCDSHEALRAALDAANKRADEAVKVSAEKLAALINPELSDARMAMIAVAEARAARAEADLAAARARVEELEREAVIDLHSTNAIRDDLAAANECIERQNANVRRLEADLAAMTERATKAEVELMDHLVGTEGVRRAIVRTQEQTRKAEDARDAALSRCSELEAQRDEARRMYCSTERALRYEQGEKFSEHDIAGEEWPAEADRLFPEKGGE